MKARFAVDLDGTLLEDDTYPEIGEWLPGAVEALHALERLGTVVIHSCRTANFEPDDTPRDNSDQVALIQEKLDEVGMGHIEIWTRGYKPPAAVYIDNRGAHFDGDWDATLERVLDILVPTVVKTVEDRNKAAFPPLDKLPKYAPTHVKTPIDEMTIKGWLDRKPPEDIGECVYLDVFPEVPTTLEYTGAQDLSGPEYGQFMPPPPSLSELFPPGTIFEVEDPDSIHVTAGLEDLFSKPSVFEPERHPSSQAFHDVLKEWGDLHDKKQADYGREDDPFANVRAGAEDMGLPPWIGCAIRMNDKMRRIQAAARQYLTTGEVSLANEALVDSFDDLGVYAGIGRVLLEQEES